MIFGTYQLSGRDYVGTNALFTNGDAADLLGAYAAGASGNDDDNS